MPPPSKREQFATHIRKWIADAQPGDQLPSTRALIAAGWSYTVIWPTMERLVDEGLIEAVPGRGRFVAERPVKRKRRGSSS